jgi:hypothetical protein
MSQLSNTVRVNHPNLSERVIPAGEYTAPKLVGKTYGEALPIVQEMIAAGIKSTACPHASYLSGGEITRIDWYTKNISYLDVHSKPSLDWAN